MDFIIVPILFGVIWFLLDKYLLSYWIRKGFPQVDTTFFVGNSGKMVTASKSIPEIFEEFYYKCKQQKFIGFYNFYKPSLLITHPELVHNVMIKDFNHFVDHGSKMDTDFDPLAGNLFSLTGKKWRDLRIKMSPAFTSGKLKWMFPLMKSTSEVLVNFIDKNSENGEYVASMNDLFSRFSSNVISSVGFGIDNDCINEPKNDFFIYGKKFFAVNIRNNLRAFMFQFFPGFMGSLKIKFAPNDVDAFFMNLIKEIVEYREKNNFKRNDFMDLLIQLKDQGYLSADKDFQNDDDDGDGDDDDVYEAHHDSLQKLTIEEVAAQAFVFFLASFETSSAGLNFCMYELAKNPKIQQKAREEIYEVFSEQGVTYDSLKNLKYLHCCFLETLRKYSPVPVLFRECTKKYNIPGTNLTVEKGTDVKIPIMAIQRDPEYYEDPLEFKPERFLNSPTGSPKLADEHGMIFYAPFGDGPRHCIGMRMAKVIAHLVFASLLSKFTFSLANERLYHEELQFNPRTFPLNPDHKIELKIKKR